MIKPTNGRIVLYTPFESELEGTYGMTVQRAVGGAVVPLAAEVVAVWGDRCVNLIVKDANGKAFVCTSRTLLQDDDVGQKHGGYAQWMDYQKGQAAKAEAAEAALKTAQAD
jgi:hypothetical protein